MSDRPYRFTADELAEWATPAPNGVWGTGKDWNTYCLAVEVQELRAEVERLTAENARIQRIAHAAGVVDLLANIDALHFPDANGWCALCRDMYPCKTARLINPEAQ